MDPGQLFEKTCTLLLLFIVLMSVLTVCGATVAAATGQPETTERSANVTANTAYASDGIDVSGVNAGTDTGADTDTDASIGPRLEQTRGELRVLVKFDETHQRPAETDTTVRTLKRVAADARQPLREFAAERDGVTVQETYWITPAALVTVDTEQIPLERVAAVDKVAHIVPDSGRQAGARVPVPRSSDGPAGQPSTRNVSNTSTTDIPVTWGLRSINTTAAWSVYGTQGDNTTVAVLDSGVAVERHDELAPVEGGWRDFVNQRSEPYDDHGHGTHVTGIVAGNTTSAGEHYGVAPDVDLVHGKVLDQSNRWQPSNLLAGFEWVVTHERDIDILVTSLYSDREYEFGLVDPVQNARANGIITVGIAGNAGPGTSTSPGNIPDALSVGSIDASDRLTDLSGGELVATEDAWPDSVVPPEWPSTYFVPEVVAPGIDVVSASSRGGYSQRRGTSFAGPHVAGVIALMNSATDRELPTDDVRRILHETATPPDVNTSDPRYGYGIVDAHDAVRAVRTPSGALNVSVTVDERPGVVGTNHNLTATVAQTTNRTVNRTLVLTAGSEQIGSEELTLPPNETQTVRTEWTPESHSSQPQRIDASVGGISDTEVIEVVKPGTFEIRSVDANESVAAGESVAVTAEVENTGGITATQTVTVAFRGEVTQTETLTIENDDTAVVTFSVQTEMTDAGISPVTVASADTESRALVEVTGGDQESTEREAQTAADDDGAGFGVAASIAGIGASWYLLKRRESRTLSDGT